jgi:flagellar capping protein FliD
MMADVSSISSYFSSLITDVMSQEKMPLYRLQSSRDTLNVRVGVYNEAKNTLSSLRDSLKALMSTSASPALVSGRTLGISNVPNGYSVLTASVSATALASAYDIHVINLAKAHQVRSNQQTYSDQALNLSGTIRLGGDAARAVAAGATIAGTVTGFDVASALGVGQTELGKGVYNLETRKTDAGAWQFRLVDLNGGAVSIANASSPGDTTSDWQSIPTGGGAFDTGRGLTINFGTDDKAYIAANRASGNAAKLTYSPKGVGISIDATDSLNKIASKINSQKYAENDGVIATVVNNYLYLTAATPGTNLQDPASPDYQRRLVQAADASGSVLQSLGVLSGGNFVKTIQNPLDATFTVNGDVDNPVRRARNTGIADVISGVTLNLAADAAGRDATLTISEDWTGARKAIDNFVTQFNKASSYLESKTGITSSTDAQGVTSYARGALADDNIFTSLRSELFNLAMSDSANSGALKNLRQIGIEIDNNLQITIADNDKLTSALKNNYDNVKKLMDSVMGSMETSVSRLVGTSGTNGYIYDSVHYLNNEITDLNGSIRDENARLKDKRDALTIQYADLQAQMLMMSYSSQQWSLIYGASRGY